MAEINPNLRVLVGIANFGEKNLEHLHRLLAEFRTLPCHCDVVVCSDIPKSFGDEVEVRVGLPTADPRSLPYAHKALFAERADDYDLFIYTEDDTLIRPEQVEAFLDVTRDLPDDVLAGFVRHEADADGRLSYPDIHSCFHFQPDSVIRVGGRVFAHLTNEHAACFMLTRDQLRRAIDSGGFLQPPRAGRYGVLETAATDPYTQCGFTKLICVSEFDRFSVHHLPNLYVDRFGLSRERLLRVIEALEAVADGRLPRRSLMATTSRLSTTQWDKFYFQRPIPEIGSLLPEPSVILSVGCGSGDLEGELVDDGHRVIGIPIDAVVGSLAEDRGVRTLTPDLEQAMAAIGDERADVLLLVDVLQFMPDPAHLLEALHPVLSDSARVLVVAPNFRHFTLRRRLRPQNGIGLPRGDFERTRLHLTDRPRIEGWLRAAGFRPTGVRYRYPWRKSSWPVRGGRLGLGGWLASSVVVAGRRETAIKPSAASIPLAREALRS